jgi:hypothetical protein
MVIRQTSRPQSLLLALLMSLCAMSVASAQPVSGRAEDLSTFVGAGRTFIVVDAAGQETLGKALRFTPEQLTIMVGATEVPFDRQNVTAVFERTNSVKKGLIIGLLSGPALAIAAVLSGDDDPLILLGAVVFSGIGAAAGTAVDALIPERHLVYGLPRKAFRQLEDLTTLGSGRTMIVADESGRETEGQLLSISSDELTMTVDGMDRRFTRQQVAALYERGDSIKNGMLVGLLAGTGAGFVAGIMKDDCVQPSFGGPGTFTPLDCHADQKFGHGLKVGALAGLAGAGIGAAFDKLIVGRRLLYHGQRPAPRATISVAPSLGLSRIGLLTRVSW